MSEEDQTPPPLVADSDSGSESDDDIVDLLSSDNEISDHELERLLAGDDLLAASQPGNDQIDEVADNAMNYDRTLPSMHPYLGEVAAVQGRTFLDSSSGDERVIIPLFPIQGVVLFPGETLPLRVFSSGKT